MLTAVLRSELAGWRRQGGRRKSQRKRAEASYWFPGNLEWDGMLIVQLPDEVTGQAIALTTRATGNFTRNASVPLMNAEEYKAAMDKAKSVKSGYTAPTATK